jgi:hypothetical protein
VPFARMPASLLRCMQRPSTGARPRHDCGGMDTGDGYGAVETRGRARVRKPPPLGKKELQHRERDGGPGYVVDGIAKRDGWRSAELRRRVTRAGASSTSAVGVLFNVLADRSAVRRPSHA